MGSADADPSGNRLAREKSPYLLQHAQDPVDWRPWGDEAFEDARRLNRPVFLSIGYSTCHWCHVMARESFENPAIAAALNRDFVCINVDREERPDIDTLYMAYVAAATGSGGWPMSVFLTPDRIPVYGGSYFPPNDFLLVIDRVASAWDPESVRAARAVARAEEALRTAPRAEPPAADPATLEALVRSGVAAAEREWNPGARAFGDAPLFPRPALISFLLDASRLPGTGGGLEKALDCLRAMAAGGINDQIGGGFHRYSVDGHWRIPHFEKMLYDQAQLAAAYTEAHRLTGDPAFAATARSVLDYARWELAGPEGGFWSAEDADSADPARRGERREGAYYTWTRSQFGLLLGPGDAEFAADAFGVAWAGNAGDADPAGELKGLNVLRAAMTPVELAGRRGGTPEEAAARLAAARQVLLLARSERPRPALDDKIVTGWNGLMISAFARGASVLGEPEYLDVARRAARFVLDNLRRPGDRPLLRRWRDGEAAVPAFLDDYAFMVRALLDLWEAGGEVAWLEEAVDLQEAQDRLFRDREGAGYFFADGLDPLLLARRIEVADGAEPAGNSVAAQNLLRLSRITDRPRFAERAANLLGWSASSMAGSEYARPAMLSAFVAAISPRREVVLAGNGRSAGLEDLRRAVLARARPGTVVLTAAGGAEQRALSRLVPWVRDMAPPGGTPAAFICSNGTCALPVTDPGEAAALAGS